MQMKVKVIEAYSGAILESALKDWLTAHPNVTIINILQSQSARGSYNNELVVVTTILYRD